MSDSISDREIRNIGRARRCWLLALGAGVTAITMTSGCARLIGDKHETAELVPMAPDAVLRIEPDQRGTRVLLTNTGPAPVEVRWPDDRGHVWTLHPGMTWKKRLRRPLGLEVVNTSGEATRLEVDARTWNFQMAYDLEHHDPSVARASRDEVLLRPGTDEPIRH